MAGPDHVSRSGSPQRTGAHRIARNQAHRWNRQSEMTRSAPLFRHSGTQHGAPHRTLPTIVHAGTYMDLTGEWLVRVKRLRRQPRSALSEEQALADA